jgi:hypothetical protein
VTGPARATAAIAVLLTGACADAIRAAGSSAASAEARADQLLGAVAARYTDVVRDDRFETGRVRLTRAALTPSRIFADTALWTARPSASRRTLSVAGDFVDNRYRFDTRDAPGPALHPGDTRHIISLEQLDESSYRWDTTVDFAIGSVTADDVAAMVTALLGSADGRSERELRAEHAALFPRATGAFGRGFSIDTLRTSPSTAGSTAVELTIGFHPDRMQGSFPALAGYLDKYLGTAKYRLTLSDRSGAVMFQATGRDRALDIRYRTRRGALVSLAGVPRPLPDTLRLGVDASMKAKRMTMAFRNLVMDFIISNRSTTWGRERAWEIVAQREPEWDLPLVTERLLRAPLARPFAGEGAMLRLAVRDSAGGQTLLTRRSRLDVRESLMMRFIGSLAAHVIGEFDGDVEVEENRFLREGFAALQADVRATAGRWRGEKENATEREARGVH